MMRQTGDYEKSINKVQMLEKIKDRTAILMFW